jgi:hypothetical protein
MLSKKITRVVVLTLVIVFMFSSVAFSSDNIFSHIFKNAMERVSINGVDVPHIKQDDVIYVPVDALSLTGARIKQEVDGLKVDTLYDVDDAYKEIKAIYDRHIERLQKPLPKNRDAAIKQCDETSRIILAEIATLDDIHFILKDDGVSSKLFFAKTFLHSVLNNEFLVCSETIEGLNGDKEAKNRLKEAEPATVIYGGYVSGTFKKLEEALKEAK